MCIRKKKESAREMEGKREREKEKRNYKKRGYFYSLIVVIA